MTRNAEQPLKENYGVTDPFPPDPLYPETGPFSTAAGDTPRDVRNRAVPDTRVAVELTWAEVILAANVGVMRRVIALKRKVPGKYGAEDSMPWWQRDIQGALGELVLAKHLGVFWNPAIGKFNERDVAGCEVRTTPWPNGCLPIHKPDRDGRYVLVTGEAPRFVIVGWKESREARRPEWWTDQNGDGRFMYYVPQSELEDIADLYRP